MSLRNCFQESIVATGRAGVVYSHPPFSSKENLHLPTCKVPGLSTTISLSSSYSCFAQYSLNRRRIISLASQAVDEVEVVTHCNWNNIVIASESPVLVEFWAPECGPCRIIAPVVNELAKEYAGKILCCKINADDWPNIATQYGVQSLPTVLFFKDGERKESIIGGVPKSTLTATIEKYLDS